MASTLEFDLHEAYARMAALGATAATHMIERRLRDLDLRGPATGPRPSTARNPAQLTNRQLEVLHLLAEGLTNVEIAAKLYRSTKTIDHHVSAVLEKLEAKNRTEAVRIAADMGLLATSAHRGAV
jgi:DNA-binding NarL/FixJ family response regulator